MAQRIAITLLAAAAAVVVAAQLETGNDGHSLHHQIGLHNKVSASSCAFSSPPSLMLTAARSMLLLPQCAHVNTKLSPCNQRPLFAYTSLLSSSNLSLIKNQFKQQRIINHHTALSLSASSSSSSSTQQQQDTTTPQQSSASSTTNNVQYPLIIIIGGTGFLGSEIRTQLKERNISYIATSTTSTQKTVAGDDDGNGSEYEEFVQLDLTANDAEDQFYKIISDAAQKKKKYGNIKNVAIISAMGSIGNDKDEEVNAALSKAIKVAHRVNNNNNNQDDDDDNNNNAKEVVVERFIMIGNTKRVRRLASNVPFLKGYASGKEDSESTLRECFGSQGCIIKPSFIYGGKEISLNPPRIPSNLGGLASEVLGLYPVQALADKLPDALAVPLAPPINVEMVASAAINVALGIAEGYRELEGEAITMAGSVRGWKEKQLYENWVRDELEKDGVALEDIYGSKEACSIDDLFDEIDDDRRWKRIDMLKQKLLRGEDPDNEITTMEELECLRPQSMKPADDPKLNGQWNFVLSKDDLGTQVIKELLPPEYYGGKDDSDESTSSLLRDILGGLYQLEGLYMRIHDEQSQVEIVLSSKIFFGKIPIDIVFGTSLLSTNYDEATDGTLFLEKFESISVGGVSLPLPEDWQRFRYLEITYLDDDIVIARGSGADPHVLVRAKE